MSLLSTLTKNNLAYMVGAEVLGTNIPRIALTRTPQERLDVFTDEAASSVGFFGGGLAVDALCEKLFAKSFQAGGNAAQWARFGKTFGVGGVLAGLLVAVAYLRNYVTAQVNKTSQFHKIIQTPGNPAYGATTEEPGLAQEKRKALRLAGLSFAAGVGVSTAAVLLAKRNIAKGVDWQALNRLTLGGKPLKLGQFLDKNILFGGQEFFKNPAKRGFLNLSHPAAFAFWVLPTYTGYFTAARSNLERVEALIKFLNFNASFFLLPPIVEKKLMPLIAKTFAKQAKNPDFVADTQFVLKQASGIGALVGSTMAYQALSAHQLAKQPAAPPFKPALKATGPFQRFEVKA
jgi:hypothetical protein